MTRTDLPTPTNEICFAGDAHQTVYEKVDIAQSACPLLNDDVSPIIGYSGPSRLRRIEHIPSVSAQSP